MELLERFENEKKTKTFRRIDNNHNLDWYIGYDENSKKAVALIINDYFIEFDSTKIIKVKLEKRIDGKLILTFSLIDERYIDIYLKFCEDLFSFSSGITKNVLKNVLIRWNMWKSTFKNMHNEKMSENEIKGLIGELIFLDKVMFSLYGIDNSIKCWQGPLNYHKDFEISDNWYEVKTISDNSLTVKINSLQQLDNKDNKNGELAIIVLKNTNEENNDYITISKLINSIDKKILDLNIKEIFWEKIKSSKYVFDEAYDKYVYELYRIKEYNVDNNEFPRICSNEIREGIVKVNYEIDIESIKKFLIEEA